MIVEPGRRRNFAAARTCNPLLTAAFKWSRRAETAAPSGRRDDVAAALRVECMIQDDVGGGPNGGERSTLRRSTLRRWMIAVAVGLTFAVGAGAGATAQTEIFTTSNGVTIEVPPVGTLETCAQMEETLARIDDTGYRRGGPESVVDPGDRQLMNYEDSVSERHFYQCDERQPFARDYLQFSN